MANNDRFFYAGGQRTGICVNCDGKKALLHVRLNPINWAPNEKLLCGPCAKRLGFSPKSYSREKPSAGFHGYGAIA